MNTLYVTIGVPCSGKSTWAKEQGIRTVSRDTERLSIFGKYRMGSEKEENTITKIVEYKVKQLLRIGDVILDNTHLKTSLLQDIIDTYKNCNIKFIKFDKISVRDFEERNIIRSVTNGKDIPLEVFNKMCKQYDSLSVPKDVRGSYSKCDPRITNQTNIVPLEDDFIGVDLDGTLALIKDRNPYDGGACATDEVNYVVKNIIDQYKNVIIFSGRNSDKGGREATEKWLKDNHIPYNELYMRKEGDSRPDTVVKEEMYNEAIVSKGRRLLFQIDDRNSVCELFRDKLNINVMQCYYGDF